jgi:F-type H+-transporting ATPase subunit gamma
VDHPLTRPAVTPTRSAVAILTSDRGFCGGFNSNVLREAQSLRGLLQSQGIETVDFVAGRKGISWHRFRNRSMAAEWSGFSDTPRQQNAAEIMQALLEAYERPTEEGGVARGGPQAAAAGGPGDG